MKALGACLGLVTADQHGAFSNRTASLEVLTRKAAHYVNVDATSISGLQTANSLGFASQQPADAVYTAFLREATQYLFDGDHPAAVFALFRHPVDRAVSLFYYLQHATWEKTYRPEFQNLSLRDFARSRADDNYMTRTFRGKTADMPLTRDDLELAKHFLEHYVLVGLTDQIDESIERFAQAFGWDQQSRWKNCWRRASHGNNRFDHPHVQPGDDDWNLLAARNEFDLELFRFAQELFVSQDAYFQ